MNEQERRAACLKIARDMAAAASGATAGVVDYRAALRRYYTRHASALSSAGERG